MRSQTQKYLSFSKGGLKKLLSEKNKVPRTLLEGGAVRQSVKLVLFCSLKLVCAQFEVLVGGLYYHW